MDKMQANTVGSTDSIDVKDIYVIKNDINNKVYVGQAIDPQKRFINHCKKSSAKNSLIGKAIQKYGKEHFWYEILESQITNYNEREKYWIKYLNSKTPNGYNILDGGDTPPVHYGSDHPLSAFEDDDIKNIKNDLKNTTLSFNIIAKKYHTSKRTIMRINQGTHYEEIGEDYPIRKNPNMNGVLTDEDVDDIINILKYSYRQYNDIGKQFGVSGNAIKLINSGEIHKKDNEKYPIRNYKNSRIPALTYEQVTEITNLLLHTTMSNREIAKMFNVELAEIYLVNNGNSKRYRRNEYNYPLRKHNKKQ